MQLGRCDEQAVIGKLRQENGAFQRKLEMAANERVELCVFPLTDL
jgi:hypothetical protein